MFSWSPENIQSLFDETFLKKKKLLFEKKRLNVNLKKNVSVIVELGCKFVKAVRMCSPIKVKKKQLKKKRNWIQTFVKFYIS